MSYSISEFIAIFFAFLLMALIVALIFRRDFRDAVLGGPGEASIAGILTVKGVAIVLLCGLLIGGILFALTKLPSTKQPDTTVGPISVRLNVHFEPNEVNPRHPDFRIKAYIKTRKGPEPIDFVHVLKQGALSVELDVPDMETPFFIVFETPRGTWLTDDFSIHETAATARRQVIIP
jgi:hypothetical protein